ncbi:MAG: GNAT family protein [Chloroflexota bacterium]
MSLPTNPPRMLTELPAPMLIEPVTLEGQSIRLEPLSLDYFYPLCDIALDEDLWRWSPAPVKTRDDLRHYIELALTRAAEGSVLPFATFDKVANRFVGSTRFLDIDKQHHHVEIGSTFIGKAWQRTAVNTEAKYLMLRHVFETWGCLRVAFQTDALNTRSRNAILRLGAQQEGLFRNHKICADGRVRDSIFFSIIDSDWPAVKANLEAKLARPYVPKF